MLARFKWLIAAVCFVIQYTVLPMIPGIRLYPDVALAGVCTLALVYGPGAGMFYGLCVGVLAGSLFTLSLARTALTYSLLGLVCGLLSNRARASKVALPLIAVGAAQVLRQGVDIAYLMLARTYFDTFTLISRLCVCAALTALCALPLYWIMYHSNFKYRVIGKRVGT